MDPGKKILMVIAPKDFRDEEYQKPKVILEQAGYEIVTASKGVRVARGTLGMIVDVDQDLATVDVNQFVGIIFIGGSGSSIYFSDKDARRIVLQAVEEGKTIGAICIAPSILANAGILSGKNATSFSSEAENLKSKGAEYTGQAVTVDGKIVTADGPEAAQDFGKKIVQALGEQ